MIVVILISTVLRIPTITSRVLTASAVPTYTDHYRVHTLSFYIRQFPKDFGII